MIAVSSIFSMPLSPHLDSGQAWMLFCNPSFLASDGTDSFLCFGLFVCSLIHNNYGVWSGGGSVWLSELKTCTIITCMAVGRCPGWPDLRHLNCSIRIRMYGIPKCDNLISSHHAPTTRLDQYERTKTIISSPLPPMEQTNLSTSLHLVR